MTRRGFDAEFCATGQTGVLIAGRGAAIDAVGADFISGAVEWLSPAAAENHWQIVEGQGSLFHPSFAGVTLGLLHGAQPDLFVVCHEPTRKTMRGVEHPLPSIAEVIETTVRLGRLTNPEIRPLGIAVNTAALGDDAAEPVSEGDCGRVWPSRRRSDPHRRRAARRPACRSFSAGHDTLRHCARRDLADRRLIRHLARIAHRGDGGRRGGERRRSHRARRMRPLSALRRDDRRRAGRNRRSERFGGPRGASARDTARSGTERARLRAVGSRGQDRRASPPGCSPGSPSRSRSSPATR